LSDKLFEAVTIECRDEAYAYVVNAVRNFASLGLLEIKEAVA
jgi:hypothetical protein